MADFNKILEKLQQLDENLAVATFLGDKFPGFQAKVVEVLGKGIRKDVPATYIQDLISLAKKQKEDRLVAQLEYILKNAKSLEAKGGVDRERENLAKFRKESLRHIAILESLGF